MMTDMIDPLLSLSYSILTYRPFGACRKEMFADPYVHQHNARTERLFSRMDQQIEDWRRRFPEGDSLRNNFKIGSQSLSGGGRASTATTDENSTPLAQNQSPVVMQSSRILKSLTELSDSHNNLSEEHKALKQQYDASQKDLRSLGALCRSHEAKSQAAFLQLEERCQSLLDSNATLEKRLDVMERLFCSRDTTGGAFGAGFASPSSRGSNSGHESQFAEMTALLRELVASNNSHQRLFSPSSASADVMSDRQVLLESKVSILETQLRDERAHHRLAVERAISDAVEQATLNLRREMMQGNHHKNVRGGTAPYGSGAEPAPNTMPDYQTTPLSLNTPPSWGRYNNAQQLKESSKKTNQSMKAFDKEEREITERRRQREREELEAIESGAEERKRQMEELRSRKNEERRAMMAQHDEVLRRQDEKRLEQAAEIQRRFEEAQRSYETTLHNARLRKESEREALLKDHRDATRDAKKDSIHSEIHYPTIHNNSSTLYPPHQQHRTTADSSSRHDNSYNSPVPTSRRDEYGSPYIPAKTEYEPSDSAPRHAYHNFGSTVAAPNTHGGMRPFVEEKLEVFEQVPTVESRPTAALHHSGRLNSPPPTDPVQPHPAAAAVMTHPSTMIPSDDDSEHTTPESITQKEGGAPLTRHFSASSRTSDTRSERGPITHRTVEDTSGPKVVPKTMSAFRSDSSHTDTGGRGNNDKNTHSPKSMSQPSSSSSSEEPVGYQLPRTRGGGVSSISPPGSSRTTGIAPGGRATAALPSLFGGILGSGVSTPVSGSSSSAPVGSRLGGAISSTASQPTRQPLKAKPLSALLKANHDSSDDSSNF